jgi:hypothetical protein
LKKIKVIDNGYNRQSITLSYQNDKKFETIFFFSKMTNKKKRRDYNIIHDWFSIDHL